MKKIIEVETTCCFSNRMMSFYKQLKTKRYPKKSTYLASWYK